MLRSFVSEDAPLPQGSHRVSGVVLRRREGSRRSQELLLFLKGMGVRRISAPGADGAKSRFGGGTEPLVWGVFDCYQSPRRFYLKGVDVRDDFLDIRRSAKKLNTAISWCKRLAKQTPVGHECDDLLALFWGSLKNLTLLSDPRLADLRFAWRWGRLWGIAPSLENCCECGARLLSLPDAAAKGDGGLVCARCASKLCGAGHLPLISPAEQETIRRAATLPRDQFLAWAEQADPQIKKTSEEYARWFYVFLNAL